MNYIKLLIIGSMMIMTLAAGAHLLDVAQKQQAKHAAQLNEIMEQI